MAIGILLTIVRILLTTVGILLTIVENLLAVVKNQLMNITVFLLCSVMDIHIDDTFLCIRSLPLTIGICLINR